MCGIVGYIGKRKAYPILMEGLHKLEYRGYDSAGCALMSDSNNLNIYKAKGKVSDLESVAEGKDVSGTLGIAHTRWATHGIPSEVNSHPHVSQDGNITLVHNGIIENYATLKEQLIEKGYTFKSETDTEVLVQLIQYIMDSMHLAKLAHAVRIALTKAIGAYAIAVIDRRNPNKLICARNSSPLAIGVSEDNSEFFVASDAGPIAAYTKKIMYLDDDEVAVCECGKDLQVFNLDNEEVQHEIKEVNIDLSMLSKGGYPHFMLKEIFDQPNVLRDCMRGRIVNAPYSRPWSPQQDYIPEGLNSSSGSNGSKDVFARSAGFVPADVADSDKSGDSNSGNDLGAGSQGISGIGSTKSDSDSNNGRGFSGFCHKTPLSVILSAVTQHRRELLRAKRIVIVSCGTSWHAGLIGKQLIEHFCRIPVEVAYASEFRYSDSVIEPDDVVMAISQSGETADTMAAMELAKEKGAMVFGIVNSVGSSIARISDTGIYIHVGPEIGVASTKAFTGQVTVLVMFALALGMAKGTVEMSEYDEVLHELVQIPDKIEKVLRQNDKIKEIAQKYTDVRNFLYLGRGWNYPVALEGALKLKEISYIHAEGYPAAEMKHGPIALIDGEMPVVFIATNHILYQKIISNMQEVISRKGKILAIVNEGDEQVRSIAENIIEVPHTLNCLAPLLTVIPLQLLSYHVAVAKGLNVDQPRNLAKSVTVE